MTSQLVAGIRALLTERADAGHPLTSLERTFILAAIAPRTRASDDVAADLEAAIVYARRVLLADPLPGADPAVVDRTRKAAARRLLAAARSCLDYDPFNATDPTATLPTDDRGGRPARADVDG